ncbi:MAG: IS607 family transposase [Candidatus Sigynarchaeota archaeon]
MTSCARGGIAAPMMGVCTRTIRRWDAAGKITCTRTPDGHRRISLIVIEGHQARDARTDDGAEQGRAAVYCRVSSHEQKAKGGLDRQVSTAARHCTKAGPGKPVVFTDVGSGLNATRPGLARLCKQVAAGLVRTVVVSFKDRLTRFGFKYLRRYFASHGASIVVARQAATRSMQDELVEALIAIVTSFSGRVHGMRGVHGTHAGKKPDPDNTTMAAAVSDAIDAAIDAVVAGILGGSQIRRSLTV